MPYRKLSVPAQLAIARYMAVDGEAWTLPMNWTKRNFRKLLRHFRSEYGHVKFGYVILQMTELLKAIEKDGIDIGEYVKGGYTPLHPKANRWPVILSGFNDETLQDGWHRLRDYLGQGAITVPAVYYP